MTLLVFVGVAIHADASILVWSSAAKAATPISSDVAVCSVEPRPSQDFVAVDEDSNAALSLMLGTPVATPVPPSGGVTADSSIVSAVTETVNEVAACVNAGDLRRLAALFTEEQFRRMYGGIGKQMLAGLGTPTALPESEHAPELSVHDVMVLPDGSISAITSAEGEQSLTIFKKVGDRYLIDYSYPPSPAATPTP